MFPIVIHNDNFNLAKITAFNNLTQEVQVLHYEPPFPSTTFYVSPSKNRNTSNISIQNILHHPIVANKKFIEVSNSFMKLRVYVKNSK